jgi:hypothetical protein
LIDLPCSAGRLSTYSSLFIARVVEVCVDVDAHEQGVIQPPLLSLSFSPPKFLSSLIACFS